MRVQQDCQEIRSNVELCDNSQIQAMTKNRVKRQYKFRRLY